MDIEKYLTFTVEWVPRIIDNAELSTYKMGDPVNVQCFTYGKNLYVRDGESHSFVSARVYVMKEKVNLGDIVDGQIVKAVDIYPVNFDPSVILYSVTTW